MIEEHYGIEILYDGTWLHEGRPITRHNLVKLFASVLKRDDKGDYWLITPAERGRIQVADAPFIAVEMQVNGAGDQTVIRLRTNVDDWVDVGPNHPLTLRAAPGRLDQAPYVMIRDGLEARLARPVYYDLVRLAEDHAKIKGGKLGVWSGGVFYPLDAA
jgi:hypothetical protein